MRPISYEVQGFPEFLRSEEACRRAIDRGTLTPATPVTVYGETGERSRTVAAQHPVLRSLFGIAEEPFAPEPVVARPEPTIAPEAARTLSAPVFRATPIANVDPVARRASVPRTAPMARPRARTSGAVSNWSSMIRPFRRYADLAGRSSRREYWLFVLLCLVASGAAVLFQGSKVSWLALFWVFAVVPAFAVHIRRLHDRGLSGWLALIGVIPYVGWLVLLAMMCLDGTPGPNRFGADPKQR